MNYKVIKFFTRSLFGGKFEIWIKRDVESEKPFKIKKSKIRGVESFGMLCSGGELQFVKSQTHNLGKKKEICLEGS